MVWAKILAFLLATLFTLLVGNNVEMTQTVSVDKDLPYGMDKKYLKSVAPVGMLRTWIGISEKVTLRKVTHSITLELADQSGKRHQKSMNFKEAHERKELSIVLPFEDIETATIRQIVTSGGSDSVIVTGPVELLIDTPFHVGCFGKPEKLDRAGILDNLSPAECSTYCLEKNDRNRFSGLVKGNECYCSSEPRMLMGSWTSKDNCNTPCSGNKAYSCGGDNSIDVYVSSMSCCTAKTLDLRNFLVAECPDGTTRFQDHCFKLLPRRKGISIEGNMDRCGDLNMTLWNPESEEEHQFVSKTFFEHGYLHLGIRELNPSNGWLAADNSFSMGNTYLKPLDLNKLKSISINAKECINYDRAKNKYVKRAPCDWADGLCKSNLVDGWGYETIGDQVDYRVHWEGKDKTFDPSKSLFSRSIEAVLGPASGRRVEIILSRQVVISGLHITTRKSKALKAFRFHIWDNDIQKPEATREFYWNKNKMVNVLRITQMQIKDLLASFFHFRCSRYFLEMPRIKAVIQY